jgi:hypothetical protein
VHSCPDLGSRFQTQLVNKAAKRDLTKSFSKSIGSLIDGRDVFKCDVPGVNLLAEVMIADCYMLRTGMVLWVLDMAMAPWLSA